MEWVDNEIIRSIHVDICSHCDRKFDRTNVEFLLFLRVSRLIVNQDDSIFFAECITELRVANGEIEILFAHGPQYPH